MNKYSKYGRQIIFDGNNGSSFLLKDEPCEIEPIIIDGTDLFYETVGKFTSWSINCTCCNKKVKNSTEIDIVHSVTEEEVRMNACHDCASIYVYPALESLSCVDGSPSARELADFIIARCGV